MDAYKSLPFATYDLAVYLPGGAVLLIVLKVIVEQVIGVNLRGLTLFDSADNIDFVIRAVTWLSASYLVGHLGAFVSTYTVERFVHTALGFPADIWLEKEKDVANGVEARVSLRRIFIFRLNTYFYNMRFSSFIVTIFQIPLVFYFLVFRFFVPVGFYSPKVPDGLVVDVSSRYAKLRTTIALENGSRWDKIVEHFVANNCQLAYVRMYNYLVIYGALRLLSFILLVILWGFIVNDIQVRISNQSIGPIDWLSTLRFQLIAGADVLAMMAFAKFNRRYFEETLMAFVLAPSRLDDQRSNERRGAIWRRASILSAP